MVDDGTQRAASSRAASRASRPSSSSAAAPAAAGLIHAGCGQWQKPFEYLPGRSSRSSVIVAFRYEMPSAAKLRPHASTAFSNGKYGSSAWVDAPASAKPVFHGRSALSPCSAASRARAACMSGRVCASSASSISNSRALPKPSACVHL